MRKTGDRPHTSDTDLRETPSYLAVARSVVKLSWSLCRGDTGRAVPGTVVVCTKDNEVVWAGGGNIATPGLQALIAPATLKR